MNKIKTKLRERGEHYIIHNTKVDVRTLAEYCNMLTDKGNELIEEVEKLKERDNK